MLADGQSYDEFKDPFKQVAQHIWKDVSEYQLVEGMPRDTLSGATVTVGRYQ